MSEREFSTRKERRSATIFVPLLALLFARVLTLLFGGRRTP
jgi:hypothetical protein